MYVKYQTKCSLFYVCTGYARHVVVTTVRFTFVLLKWHLKRRHGSVVVVVPVQGGRWLSLNHRYFLISLVLQYFDGDVGRYLVGTIILFGSINEYLFVNGGIFVNGAVLAAALSGQIVWFQVVPGKGFGIDAGVVGRSIHQFKSDGVLRLWATVDGRGWMIRMFKQFMGTGVQSKKGLQIFNDGVGPHHQDIILFYAQNGGNGLQIGRQHDLFSVFQEDNDLIVVDVPFAFVDTNAR